MMLAAGSTQPEFRFARALARHLAARVAEGVACSEVIVRECYARTRHDLHLQGHADEIEATEEIENIFVHDVVSMMACHQRFIAHMPEPIAGVFIAELLFDKS